MATTVSFRNSKELPTRSTTNGGGIIFRNDCNAMKLDLLSSATVVGKVIQFVDKRYFSKYGSTRR